MRPYFSRLAQRAFFLTQNNHSLTSWWFLRGLGLIYLGAFASMLVQVEGLIGAEGILPVHEQLQRIAAVYPKEEHWRFPTVFWFDASDAALKNACIAGIVAAGLLVLNLLTRLALFICFILYLSIATAGQDFTSFQWDALLLESGFLALFLTWRSKIVVMLYRLLLVRFMFMSGLVKIASGDPNWLNLSALKYHYETQPLPSPLAYYAQYLPSWFHELCTAGVLFIELAVPFLVLLPRPFRLFAAWSFILLQCSIILTGNYTFFNLLTLLLCLFLFEDRNLARLTPAHLGERILRRFKPPGFIATFFAMCWTVVVVTVLATQIWMAQANEQPIEPLQKLLDGVAVFNVINNYGPFAVMTTKRDEVILEGSEDGEHWQEYGSYFKPDALDKPLLWIIPHQPRLDWQLWFVPLNPYLPPWFDQFMRRVKQGSKPVLALLKYNPFPEKPPKYLRANLYLYQFTEPSQRKLNGQIWRREKQGVIWE